jgi:hypothetical protein
MSHRDFRSVPLHERIILTRNGEPEAVLLSVDDLEGLEVTLEILGDTDAVARISESLAALGHAEPGADMATVRQDLARRRVTGARQPNLRSGTSSGSSRTRGERLPNRRGEPHPFAGSRIDALVVDPRRPHLDRACAGQHLPVLVVTIADHQTAAIFAALGERTDSAVQEKRLRRGLLPGPARARGWSRRVLASAQTLSQISSL